MKMKRFDSKVTQSPLSPKKKKPTGKVGAADKQTKKGPSASDPQGQIGIFYQPDKSFTPASTKRVTKKRSTIQSAPARSGRSGAAKKMAKKRPTRNPVK